MRLQARYCISRNSFNFFWFVYFRFEDIKQAVQRTKNKIRTPADQYTGIESLAMNDMSKGVKETSVFRQDLAKHETISDGARAKIRNILIKQHVKSNEIPGKHLV